MQGLGFPGGGHVYGLRLLCGAAGRVQAGQMPLSKVVNKFLCGPGEPEPGMLYREYAPLKTNPVVLIFIPCFAWANRGEEEMRVWVRI